MLKQVATRIIAKYLRKGNMARCLRDILPSSGLSKEQREQVAEIVHDIVRWRKLYEHILDCKGVDREPSWYVRLAIEGAQAEAAGYPFEFRYSCSSYVARILSEHAEWAEYLNEKPPTTLCANLNLSTTDQVMKLLSEEHIFSERSILDTAILTTSVGKYSQVLQQRFAHVQDENSQFIAYLAASFGECICDFCAGNGGKSLAMASLGRNEKKIFAYDASAGKRSILRKRASEYKANVKVEESVPGEAFDVVLVDAPCTGLGAARRNPEAKYIEGSGDFPLKQLSILRQAAGNVRKQGFLLYTVCTITPEETSGVVNVLSKNSGFSVASLSEVFHHEFLLPTEHGAFTVLPRGDLFYVSLLQKN